MTRIIILILLFILVFNFRMPWLFNYINWTIWRELYKNADQVYVHRTNEGYITFKWNNIAEYSCNVYEAYGSNWCEIYKTANHEVVFSSYWCVHSKKLANKLMESKERIDKEFNEQIEQLKHYANN